MAVVNRNMDKWDAPSIYAFNARCIDWKRY